MADMRNTHTSQHPSTPGIEWKVSYHQPMKSVPQQDTEGDGIRNAALIRDGEGYPVIELFVRQSDGSWVMVASYRQYGWDEQVADIERLVSLFGLPLTDEDNVTVRQSGTEFKLTRRADAPELPPLKRRVLTGDSE